MPHSRLEDLPNGGDRWPALGREGFRQSSGATWRWATPRLDEPLDCTHSYTFGGLPGGVCPCPHYGYLFEGRIRAVYPGSDWPDEVIEAGEAYFIPSGHVLIYEEAKTRCFELNPSHALGMCMDAMQRAVLATQAKQPEVAPAAE